MWDRLLKTVENFLSHGFLFLILGILFLCLTFIVLVMNSKTSVVVERRLKPLYDLLDNGNNKKAIQEADKVLKKQPTLFCAKVLKALALLRIGKESECLELLEAVRKERPTDDPTLQAMTLCYKDLNKFQVICEFYDAARTQNPNNEDILINLFYAYTRVEDYVNQQLTAMTLVKLWPKKYQYRFWLIMCTLLKVIPIDELTEHCKPPLCEFKKPFIFGSKERSNAAMSSLQYIVKVIDKMDEFLDTPSKIMVVVAVMKIVGNYERALSILETFGNKLPEPLCLKEEVSILIKINEWVKVNHKLKELIKSEPDNWTLYQYYLESVFQIDKGDTVNTEESGYSFQLAKEFIDSIINDNRNCKKRGPYLAQLEFYKLLKINNFAPSDIYDDLEGLLMTYATEFGHLDCCSRDLIPYLCLLSKNETKSFLNLIWMSVDLKKGKYPSNKTQMSYHLNNLEMTRVSGIMENMLIEDKVALVNSLINYFIHAQEFHTNVPPTETRSSDRYLLLAMHTLYDLWNECMDCNYLFEAIVLAHFGLKFSPSNRQFKLILVKFYHLLGGTTPAHASFKDLGTKHMQIDSLDYIHLWPTLSCGDFIHASDLILSSFKFYSNNFKDSADHVISAYKFDAFIKIPEFVSIKGCLNNSLHYMLVKVEDVFLRLLLHYSMPPLSSIMNESDSCSLLEDFDWAKVYDNRDFRVLWAMDGDHKSPHKVDVEQSMNQEFTLLKLRLITFKFVSILYYLSEKNSINSPTNKHPVIGKSDSGDDTSGCDSGNSDSPKSLKINGVDSSTPLSGVIKDLSEVLSAFKEKAPCEIPQNCVTSPPNSRLLYMFQYKYFSIILYSINFFQGLILTGEESDAHEVQKFLNYICIYFGEYFNHITQMVDDQNLIRRRNILIASVLYLEIISISCILFRTMESMFGINKSNINKKTKKKKELTSLEGESNWKEEMVKDYKQCIFNSSSKVLDLLEKEEKLWNDKSTLLGSITSISISDEDHLQSILNLAQESASSISFSQYACLHDINVSLSHRVKEIQP